MKLWGTPAYVGGTAAASLEHGDEPNTLHLYVGPGVLILDTEKASTLAAALALWAKAQAKPASGEIQEFKVLEKPYNYYESLYEQGRGDARQGLPAARAELDYMSGYMFGRDKPEKEFQFCGCGYYHDSGGRCGPW